MTPEPILLPKSIPQPVYTFQVNNIDYQSIYSSPPPDDNIQNIIGQLESAAVFIDGVPGQLKYGSTFTLYGREAERVYNLYIGKTPKTLNVVQLPDVQNFDIEWTEDAGVALISWTPSGSYMTEISYSTDNITYLVVGFAYGVGEVIWDVGGPNAYVKARFINAQGAYSPDYATAFIVNSAPVLDASKTPVLSAIGINSPSPSGAVGSLVGGSLVDNVVPAGGLDNVTDADGDVIGVAIVAADSTNGTWSYSINGGTTWNALGVVSNSVSRLLAPTARLYFQPDTDFSGTINPAITFRAWDQTTGTNGGTANTTSNGGTTAFSATTDTASITIS